MDITDDEVRRLSELSRISLSEEESQTLKGNLQKVVQYIEQLKSIPTDEVPLCTQMNAPDEAVFRPDTEEETLTRERFLDNAPDHVGGMIRVPNVITFT